MNDPLPNDQQRYRFEKFIESRTKNTGSGVTNYVKYFLKQLCITASVDTLRRNTLVETFFQYNF